MARHYPRHDDKDNQEEGNVEDNSPAIRLGRSFGFQHIVQYTAMVLTIGGGWWYMRVAVDSLRVDVEMLKADRVVTVDKLARLESKIDFLIQEVGYLRYYDTKLNLNKQGKDQK